MLLFRLPQIHESLKGRTIITPSTGVMTPDEQKVYMSACHITIHHICPTFSVSAAFCGSTSFVTSIANCLFTDLSCGRPVCLLLLSSQTFCHSFEFARGAESARGGRRRVLVVRLPWALQPFQRTHLQTTDTPPHVASS